MASHDEKRAGRSERRTSSDEDALKPWQQGASVADFCYSTYSPPLARRRQQTAGHLAHGEGSPVVVGPGSFTAHRAALRCGGTAHPVAAIRTAKLGDRASEPRGGRHWCVLGRNANRSGRIECGCQNRNEGQRAHLSPLLGCPAGQRGSNARACVRSPCRPAKCLTLFLVRAAKACQELPEHGHPVLL
jgi:hypothetical protein